MAKVFKEIVGLEAINEWSSEGWEVVTAHKQRDEFSDGSITVGRYTKWVALMSYEPPETSPYDVVAQEAMREAE